MLLSRTQAACQLRFPQTDTQEFDSESILWCWFSEGYQSRHRSVESGGILLKD
jgi:hypothetical protein